MLGKTGKTLTYKICGNTQVPQLECGITYKLPYHQGKKVLLHGKKTTMWQKKKKEIKKER